jgi:hypothetical protein
MICVWVINKPSARRIEYIRLLPWTRHRGSKQIFITGANTGQETSEEKELRKEDGKETKENWDELKGNRCKECSIRQGKA